MRVYKLKTKVILSLFLLSVFSGLPVLAQENGSNITFFELPRAQASDGDLVENAHVWINSDGWVNSRYSIEGTNIEVADIALDYLEVINPNLFNSLGHVHWSFGNGVENNVWIEFRFFEDDLGIAEGYAAWIIEFVNALSVTQYSYEGNWIDYGQWNPNTGLHENVNVINYRASAPWPSLVEQFQTNIPRDQGGLAETVNISECDSFVWNWWHGDSHIVTDLGFEWHGGVDKLNGHFEFDMAELVHVDSLIKPLGDDGRTHMWFSLPDVENLQITPAHAILYDWTADRNPWDRDDYYGIELNLNFTNPSELSFNISFDNQFIPWDQLSRQEYNLELNPYGYAYENLNIKHEDANLIDFRPIYENFDGENLWSVDLVYYPELYDWEDKSGYMYASYINLSAGVPYGDEIIHGYNDPHEWLAENITYSMVNDYGWTVGVESTWNDTAESKGMIYPLRYYYFEFNHTWTPSTWNALWDTSDIIDISPFMQSADLISANRVVDRYYNRIDPEKYPIKEISYEWNPLYSNIQNPVKMFSEFSGTSHNIDVAAQLNMPYVETNDSFFMTTANIMFPESIEYPEISITQPERNHGYGFGYGHHNGYWGDWYDYGNHHTVWYDYFVNDADYWPGETGITLPPNNLVIDFNYDFHADSEDLINPYGNIQTDGPISGASTGIVLNANDESGANWWSNDWYNVTDHTYVSRFPSSGIDTSSMQLDLYFAEIPIEDYHWGPYYPSYTGGSYDFLELLDTTVLPDGMIYFEGSVADNAGNVGYFGKTIEVDNYVGEYYAPEITLMTGSPLNESHIEGEVTFEFNISDDVDVFAATATVGPQIHVGTSYVMNETGTDIFEFVYNTQVEPENEDRWIVITAWDMDGHKVQKIYMFTIDNIPAGDAPLVEIMSPTEGDIFNATEITTVVFEVNATDDNGISSIQGQIDDRTPGDMTYNAGTGFYEFSYDITNLVNGTHDFTVIVFDVDDADTTGGGDGQHKVTKSISFTVLNDVDPEDFEPPEFRDVQPGNLTSATDIISGNLTFSIDVRDDSGIENIQLTLGTATDYTDINVAPTDVDTVEFQNFQTIDGYPKNMDYQSIDGDGWETYEQTLDTSTTPNGFYIVKIQVGDEDPVQNQVDIYFIMLINNEAGDNPFAEIPGFPVPILLMGVASTLVILYRKNKK